MKKSPPPVTVKELSYTVNFIKIILINIAHSPYTSLIISGVGACIATIGVVCIAHLACQIGGAL